MTCRPLLAVCACLLLGMLPPLHAAATVAPPRLIPQPAQMTVSKGSFRVDARTSLVVIGDAAATRRTADYLNDLLARTRGLH